MTKFGIKETLKKRDKSPEFQRRREEFLKKHPICQKCKTKPSTDLHHRDGNFENNNPRNWKALCFDCHSKIPKPTFIELSLSLEDKKPSLEFKMVGMYKGSPSDVKEGLLDEIKRLKNKLSDLSDEDKLRSLAKKYRIKDLEKWVSAERKDILRRIERDEKYLIDNKDWLDGKFEE